MPKPAKRPSEPQLERRTVEVHEPALSESTKAKLTDEVRDVIGADEERPAPTTVAAMEQEGVNDPEQLFSDVCV
jgi:hypothetical protein